MVAFGRTISGSGLGAPFARDLSDRAAVSPGSAPPYGFAQGRWCSFATRLANVERTNESAAALRSPRESTRAEVTG